MVFWPNEQTLRTKSNSNAYVCIACLDYSRRLRNVFKTAAIEVDTILAPVFFRLALGTYWRRQKEMNRDTPGIVYLLHFTTPYKHAGHYLGWTVNLKKRLREHVNGNRSDCVLTSVVRANGSELILARTWRGPLALEKRFKRWHKNPQLCPICNKRITDFELELP